MTRPVVKTFAKTRGSCLLHGWARTDVWSRPLPKGRIEPIEGEAACPSAVCRA